MQSSRENAYIGGEMLSWLKFQQQYKIFSSEKRYTSKYRSEVIGSICHQGVSWMIRLEAEESPWPILVNERESAPSERGSDVSILLYKYCERKVVVSFIRTEGADLLEIISQRDIQAFQGPL